MNEEKLEQILNKIGQTEISSDVTRMAQQSSQSFIAALNLLQSQRSSFFIAFKRIAVAAGIFFAFAVGLSMGRWSKPANPFNAIVLTSTIPACAPTGKNADGFWRQKALAAMRPRPQLNQTARLNAYKQYLKEKYND